MNDKASDQEGIKGPEIDDGDKLQVLSLHHPKFIQLISACMKFGKRCLIENVGEKIDRSIYPLFNREMLVKVDERYRIHLQGDFVDIDENFKLYITTEINNPIFSPEVAVFANFINFAVTQEGLEAQLLSVIVR